MYNFEPYNLIDERFVVAEPMAYNILNSPLPLPFYTLYFYYTSPSHQQPSFITLIIFFFVLFDWFTVHGKQKEKKWWQSATDFITLLWNSLFFFERILPVNKNKSPHSPPINSSRSLYCCCWLKWHSVPKRTRLGTNWHKKLFSQTIFLFYYHLSHTKFSPL